MRVRGSAPPEQRALILAQAIVVLEAQRLGQRLPTSPPSAQTPLEALPGRVAGLSPRRVG
jgi:hypothetical protein